MKIFIFLFFFAFYFVNAQISYDVQSLYKPKHLHSVTVLPRDTMLSENYEINVDNTTNVYKKDFSENSLKKLAEKYYADVDSTEHTILEELDQLKDLLGERDLYLTIF